MGQIIASLAEGFGQNLFIFAFTLVVAVPAGLLVAMGSMSKFKPLAYLVKTFVWIIRGTPLMLQIFVVMYAPGLLFDFPIRERMIAVLIAFIINYACYFSEIYRGGIEAIPKGQYEAGQVLGMTKTQVFFKVVLMQVVKKITPAMGNEVLTLCKDTSLARVVGIPEIIMSAERFTKQGLIWPLFSTGLFFLVMCGILTILLNLAEKKLSYYEG